MDLFRDSIYIGHKAFILHSLILYRDKWNRIVAVQLFISHCTVGVGFNVTESSINRLFVVRFTNNIIIYNMIKLLLCNTVHRRRSRSGRPGFGRTIILAVPAGPVFGRTTGPLEQLSNPYTLANPNRRFKQILIS